MAENTLLHLKHKIESLLFSAARRLTVDEIRRLTRANEEDVLRCLHDYKKELEEKGSSIHLVKEDDTWQLTVKDQYIPVIKKVVTRTEMPKTIVETLAVVAYKAPVLQSAVVKVRTNKAYTHLAYLEKEGFITREKKGRTRLLRLTPKFYDYFNLDPRQVKQAFEEQIKVMPYGKKELDNAVKEAEKEVQEDEKKEKGSELTAEEKKVDAKVKELLTGEAEKEEKKEG